MNTQAQIEANRRNLAHATSIQRSVLGGSARVWEMFCRKINSALIGNRN